MSNLKTVVRVVPVLLLVLALAPPAGADHVDPHPTKRTERTYLHCVGDVKVQNVAAVQNQWPTWDTTAPGQSVQDGAGCGYYENLLSNDQIYNPYDFTIEGTFTGNLDSLTVHLHNMYVGVFRALPPFFLGARVQIDGQEWVNTPVDTPIEITPVAENSGVTEGIVFTVTNLPYMVEDGDGEITRQFTIQIKSYNDTQSNWVYDTTEVPAGITFNPTSFEGAIVPAN